MKMDSQLQNWIPYSCRRILFSNSILNWHVNQIVFFISGIMMEINSCSFTEKEKREREKETKFNKIDTMNGLTELERQQQQHKSRLFPSLQDKYLPVFFYFISAILIVFDFSLSLRRLSPPGCCCINVGTRNIKKCRTYISTSASSLCVCCESMQEKRVRAYNSTNVYFVCCYDMAK